MLTFSLYTVKVVGHLTPQSREHTGTEDCFSFILLLKVEPGKSKCYILRTDNIPPTSSCRTSRCSLPAEVPCACALSTWWNSIWGFVHACAHDLYLRKKNAHIKQRKTCNKRINKDRDKQVTVNL